MKAYDGIDVNILVTEEDISIVNKKNINKGKFPFSSVTELGWLEPTDSMPFGTLKLRSTVRNQLHFIRFSPDNREKFLELRDLIAQKSGVEFQVETFGGQVADTFKTGLKAIFWLGLGVILMLSALQSMFGIFG
ncbi:MAG: hypothetical protein FWE24_09170 [Defluviitaleaceae bacterium]|nr:hypothetical protein [Defluviitaleaceae bacterium]